MQAVRIQPPRQLTKAQIKAVRKAENELMDEADKQMDLNFASWIIALNQHWGYGKKRIAECICEMSNAFSEIGADINTSMIQALDEETGIEMQVGDGTSWQEHPFLNAKLWNGKAMDPYKYIKMKQIQKVWAVASVEATILLTMHRRYGFSAERDRRLLEQMRSIKNSCNYDPKKIKALLKELTGIELCRTEKGTVFIYPMYPVCVGCDVRDLKICDKCEKKIDYEMRYMNVSRNRKKSND